MTDIPNVMVTLRCEACGHRQQVTSAAAMKDEEGKPHYWFGSRYDFCDRCGDGPLKPVQPDS